MSYGDNIRIALLVLAILAGHGLQHIDHRIADCSICTDQVETL